MVADWEGVLVWLLSATPLKISKKMATKSPDGAGLELPEFGEILRLSLLASGITGVHHYAKFPVLTSETALLECQLRLPW